MVVVKVAVLLEAVFVGSSVAAVDVGSILESGGLGLEKEEAEEDAVEEGPFHLLGSSLVAVHLSLAVETSWTTTTSPLLATHLPSHLHGPPPLRPTLHPLPNPQLNSQHPRLPRRQKGREPAEQT